MSLFKKYISYIVFLVLWLILAELLGYLFLKHIGLDGMVCLNNNVGLKIRSYLIDPNKSEYKPKYLPQYTLGYIHNPYYYKNGILQNNKFGWRGKSPPIFKEEKTYRIICLGGSTTYGYGVEHSDSTYPAFLERNLKEKYPDRKIEVINAGIEGLSSFGELQNYLYKVKYLKPDAVILKSGGNDAIYQTLFPISRFNINYSPDDLLSHAYTYSLSSINPNIRFLMKSYFASAICIFIGYHGFLYNNDQAESGMFRRKLDEVHEWFDKDLDFALNNLDYYSFYNNFSTLIHLMANDGVKIYAMPFAINKEEVYKYEGPGRDKFVYVNSFNDSLMKKIIQKSNQKWIPLYSDSVPLDAWLGDHCHFNARGNKFKAEFISRYIDIQ